MRCKKFGKMLQKVIKECGKRDKTIVKSAEKRYNKYIKTWKNVTNAEGSVS